MDDAHLDPRRSRRHGKREEVAHRRGVLTETAAERVRGRQRSWRRCDRGVAAGAGERPDGQARGTRDPPLFLRFASAPDRVVAERLGAVDPTLERHDEESRPGDADYG
jgi:hypothetical protein